MTKKNIEKKSAILKAAIKLLQEKDISKITTREVVSKANVNISLLHYYFKTKNDLFVAAIQASTEDYFRNWISENINFENPCIEDVEKYLDFILAGIDRYPSISRSQVTMFLQGVDLKALGFGIDDDLHRLLIGILKENNNVPNSTVTEKVHLISQWVLSLRVSTALVNLHTGLDFSIDHERRLYIKRILSEIIPSQF